ncbi:ABC transporter ATP-binding protein, partial [Streptomyces sp. NPDC057927]
NDVPILLGDDPWVQLATVVALALLVGAVTRWTRFGRELRAVVDPLAASYADAVVFLADGRMAGQLHAPTADVVAERLAHLGDDTRVGV